MHKIEPKPSRLLGLLLLGMTALSLLAIHLAAIPAIVQVLMSLAVVALSVWGWMRGRFTEALRITGNGVLQCQDRHGEWCDVEVLGDSLVSPALIVIRYRPGAESIRTQVLFHDSAPADDLRRLRVLLRWIRRTHSDTASPDAG